jgi:hypothetical protein
LKGDVQIRVRGANALAVKEQAQVRINEFMNMISQNPIFAQIIGDEGIINMLREVAKGLDLDVSKVLPSAEEIRERQALMQQQAMLAQAAGAAQAGQPTDSINIARDQDGAVTGINVMPQNTQELATGAPVTANFAPQRGV